MSKSKGVKDKSKYETKQTNKQTKTTRETKKMMVTATASPESGT